jgi:hypothetical protein
MVVDFLLKDEPLLLQRLGVIFDHDRDLRVLDLLSATHYSAPRIRSNIVALAERDGRVDVWYSDITTLSNAQRALSEAAWRALYPTDKWVINPPRVVTMVGGQLDRSKLGADSPLLVIPAQYALGLVKPRQDGFGRCVSP